MISTLASASTFSPTVDFLFKLLLFVSTFLVSLVFAAILFLCVKYRANSKANRSHPPTQATWLELTIAGIIFLFGLSVFIKSAQYFYYMYTPPAEAQEINVIAKRWMWIFHRQNEPDQINVMKVALGRPVKLIMTSQDIIHSFFIPAFRVKQDVLPGRYTSLWFTPTEIGKFDILCSQYCGLNHSAMRAIVEVVSPEEFDASKLPVLDQRGEALYRKKSCVTCHEGSHPDGPSLAGIFGQSVKLQDGTVQVADENYLRRSILNPSADIVEGYTAQMPSYQGQLTEDELFRLVEYLKGKK